jgi:acyl-coenzyme A synthetase/AMP-(fatty) acid ligase
VPIDDEDQPVVNPPMPACEMLAVMARDDGARPVLTVRADDGDWRTLNAAELLARTGATASRARLEGMLHSAAPCPHDLKSRWTNRVGPERIYLDSDGCLYPTDRTADVFTVGGASVSAREVEAVLTAHPKVGEAVVGRQGDELLGSVVQATIVPVDPEHPPGEAALKEFCRGRLPAFKVPVTIAVVNELARSRAERIYARAR